MLASSFFWSTFITLSTLLLLYIRIRMIKTPSHFFTDPEDPMVIAHRGGRGLWPENTLFAFHKARELNVDAIEFDTQRTKDGIFVIMHDTTVDRTTNGSGYVRDFTLAEIQALDAGYRWSNDHKTFPFRGLGIVVPTLEEVLQQFPQMKLNIEIKECNPDAANDLLALISKYNAADRIMIGSFFTRVVIRTRTLSPRIATSAGRAEIAKFFALQLLGLARFYALPVHALEVPEYEGELRVVSKRFIKAALRRNALPVYVWTVNEKEKMMELLNMGVRGIISDYPDRAIQAVREFKEQNFDF
ncbi:MAG: glycerophosphodiester phosphodiesterase [Calditrichaeota bacterium]|nr:MAG: glycerophosphodiester phosphodiesterase [Calditrichota bacterium]